MASLKGHTGSAERVSAVLAGWDPLIFSAGSQLAGPSPRQRDREAGSLVFQFGVRLQREHKLTHSSHGSTLRGAGEGDQARLCGPSEGQAHLLCS